MSLLLADIVPPDSCITLRLKGLIYKTITNSFTQLSLGCHRLCTWSLTHFQRFTLSSSISRFTSINTASSPYIISYGGRSCMWAETKSSILLNLIYKNRLKDESWWTSVKIWKGWVSSTQYAPSQVNVICIRFLIK